MRIARRKDMAASPASELRERFGERVSLDVSERYVYSRDVGEFPSLVGKLVGGLAQAVVQVREEEELAWLMDFSLRFGIPLTPRAGATSGYGGTVPVRGGVVVDLTRMNRILEVNEDEAWVRVQPGVIWWDLEKELRAKGLSLRAYPSSAPSSTVGGWVAGGGSGIGAYGYGGVRDVLLGLRVLTPGGASWVSGDDLDLYVGSEGVLGFITEVELAVRPALPESPLLFSFPGPREVQSFIDDAAEAYPPGAGITGPEGRRKEGGAGIFHLQVINPALAALKNRTADRAYLPEGSYLVLVVAEGQDGEAVRERLHGSAVSRGGEALAGEVAEREWEERLYPMRIKKVGPSLVPAEAEVPTLKVGDLLAETSRRLPDLAMEVVVGKGTSVCLGFIPCDSRASDFTVRFTASLEFLRLAEKHGGAPYGVGLYFVDRAERKLGKRRLRRLEEYKRETDPGCLLNPGKVLPSCAGGSRLSTLRLMMAAGSLSLPLSVPLGRLVPGVRLLRRRLPEKVEEAAFTCAQCGYCKEGCTLFEGRGWESASPRGKMQLLRGYARGEVPFSQEMSDTFLLCTTCKKCDLACQTDLPIESVWEEMRGELISRGKFHTFPPFEMMGASYDLENNIWAGFAADRSSWLPEDVKPLESGPVGYWAGCTASYVEQDIARGAVRILKEGGVDFVYLGNEETCCGVPFLMSGKWDLFEKALRRNIRTLRERGVKTLYTSCPGCWVTLAHHYRDWAEKLGLEWDVEVRHISQLAAQLVEEGRLKFEHPVQLKATWHDPCHIGRHGGIYEEPRRVLQAIPGLELVEMEHNREEGLCCGSVLTLIGETRPTSGRIASLRLAEARKTGAQAVITTCPCCEFQLRVWNAAEGDGLRVLDFAAVVAQALGVELEDPDPKVQDAWAVFDTMIQLMTPRGMADFMWEFLDTSLPLMGRLLRLGKRIPLPLKRALFAVSDRAMSPLVPRMLPVMMPWMLPRMMPLMEKRMPTMSDSMRVLMPAVLPRVMERVMPYMMPGILRCVLEVDG